MRGHKRFHYRLYLCTIRLVAMNMCAISEPCELNAILFSSLDKAGIFFVHERDIIDNLTRSFILWIACLPRHLEDVVRRLFWMLCILVDVQSISPYVLCVYFSVRLFDATWHFKGAYTSIELDVLFRLHSPGALLFSALLTW